MADEAGLQGIPDFMDLDLVPELADELLDVNNEFIDEYLKRVRGAASVRVPFPAARVPFPTAVLSGKS